MATTAKKQWFKAKYERRKPGTTGSVSTGSKSFFVYTHQEAVDTLLFEQSTQYPGQHILVTPA